MDYKEVKNMIKKYNGPKIGFVITGGGTGIANIARVPGSSKIIHEICIPYSVEASRKFVSNNIDGYDGFENLSVSAPGSILLCRAAKNLWGNSIAVISCTAALTTDRFRRGGNHAWISMQNSGDMDSPIFQWHLELSKMSSIEHKKASGYISWKRRNEDRQITDFIIKIISILEKNNATITSV